MISFNAQPVLYCEDKLLIVKGHDMCYNFSDY